MPLQPAIQEVPQPRPNAIIEEYRTDSDDEAFSSDDEDNLSFLDFSEKYEVDDSYFFYHYDSFANIFNNSRSAPPREKDSLKFAIKDGDIETVKSEIEKMDLATINYSSENTSSFLMTAAYVQNIEILDLLIDKKADINLQNKEHVTPLSIAREFNASGMIDLLISKNADLTSVNIYGESVFELALRHKQYDIAKTLNNAGAQTHGIEKILISAIENLATHEDVDRLLEYCQEIDDDAPDHYTPLMASTKREMFEYTVTESVELIRLPVYGQTDATEIMERLIEFKVQLIAQIEETP